MPMSSPQDYKKIHVGIVRNQAVMGFQEVLTITILVILTLHFAKTLKVYSMKHYCLS